MNWTPSEIKARRVAKGWTQQQLADEIFKLTGRGGRRSVINWEAGTSQPHDRFYAILDQVLGDVEPGAPTEHDPPLSRATFTQVLNRLVDIHNDVARASVDRVLRVEDAPLPADFEHDHDVAAGPAVADQPDGTDDDTATQSLQLPNE